MSVCGYYSTISCRSQRRMSLFDDLSLNLHTAFVRTAGGKALGARFSAVKLRAAAKRENIRIDDVPQLMAQRRAEVPHDEAVACLMISAATVAFGDGKLDFCHRSVLLNLYGDEIANLIQKPHADALYGRKLFW